VYTHGIFGIIDIAGFPTFALQFMAKAPQADKSRFQPSQTGNGTVKGLPGNPESHLLKFHYGHIQYLVYRASSLLPKLNAG